MSLRHIPTSTDEEIRSLLDGDNVAAWIRIGDANRLIQDLANHILSLRTAIAVHQSLDEAAQ